MKLKAQEFTLSTWKLFETALWEGAVQIETIGAWKQAFNHVDLLEGHLWLVTWKDELRAFIRCKDEDLAFEAGMEFASNGGSPWKVVDVYDWTEDLYRKNKKGLVVTTKELSVEQLTLEKAQTLNLEFTCK